jgi:hypothetical protein
LLKVLNKKGRKNKVRFFAYLDPSAGSLFFQAVFGTAVAGGLIMKTAVRNTVGKVKPSFLRKEN